MTGRTSPAIEGRERRAGQKAVPIPNHGAEIETLQAGLQPAAKEAATWVRGKARYPLCHEIEPVSHHTHTVPNRTSVRLRHLM